VLELDEDVGGSRLIQVLLGEADLRRAVGVAVDLSVEGLGLRVGRLGLLAEAQLGDLVVTQR
jgi:hypothetical protein